MRLLKFVVMEIAHAARLTVDGDTLMYPSTIAYYDRRREERRPLWWDLAALFSWFVDRGDAYSMKNWLRKFARLVQDVAVCRNGVLLRTQDTPTDHVANLCTTTSLITMLWQSISYSKSPDLKAACLKVLLRSVDRVVVDLPAEMLVMTLNAGGCSQHLQITASGQLLGLGEWLLHAGNGNWINSAAETWNKMCEAGSVHGSLLDASLAIADVIYFASFLYVWRSKCHQRSLSDAFKCWWNTFRDGSALHAQLFSIK
jgi:hypothetical protein